MKKVIFNILLNYATRKQPTPRLTTGTQHQYQVVRSSPSNIFLKSHDKKRKEEGEKEPLMGIISPHLPSLCFSLLSSKSLWGVIVNEKR